MIANRAWYIDMEISNIRPTDRVDILYNCQDNLFQRRPHAVASMTPTDPQIIATKFVEGVSLFFCR